MKKTDIAKKMNINSRTLNGIKLNGESANKIHGNKEYKGSSLYRKTMNEMHGKKGHESLNRPRNEKNEGERNYLGKNEENKQ
jgi:hypothetical protein